MFESRRRGDMRDDAVGYEKCQDTREKLEMELSWNRRGFNESSFIRLPPHRHHKSMQGHARISDDDPSASVTIQCPLSSNPELEIISRQVGDGWAREYRVDNFRTLVSGRVIRGDSTWGWVDILLISTAIWLAYVQPERLLEWDWTAHRGTLFKWVCSFNINRCPADLRSLTFPKCRSQRSLPFSVAPDLASRLTVRYLSCTERN